MAVGDRNKTAAIVYADLDRSTLGTPSRISQRLAGRCVLARTVKRLEQARRVDEIIVFCPHSQQGQIGKLVEGTRAVVGPLGEVVPVSDRIRHRKWALRSWRGGIHEATQFDEQAFTNEMAQYLRQRGIATAAPVAVEAVLIDPELLDGLLKDHSVHKTGMQFTFSQAGVGLCGWALQVGLLGDLAQSGRHIGDLLSYNPQSPHADLLVQECNYKVEPKLYMTEFRYTADTQCSIMAIEKLIEQAGGSLDGWDAVRIVTAMDRQQEDTDILPREVEIEINTATSLRIDGYPHREHRGGSSRAEMPLSQFEKIVADLQEYDDICLTIGGIGEPLAHGDLMKMIEAAKAAGIMGINIETDGRLLKDELAERLLASQVDTISVYLDAEGAVLYQQIKGEDRLEGIVGGMESFIDTSDGRGPQIVPHLVKTRATMVEMEAFYDRWISRCGCAVITGYNDFAGQIEDKAVMDMSPPRRRPCRRLSGCMTILADGSATICSQDFMGRCAIGNVNDTSVSQLWRSEKMEQLRRAHRGGRFDVNELCGRCKEWHR